MRALVTGGAGFLGSSFIRGWLSQDRGEALNVDALTYAASLARVDQISDNPRYHFLRADITDRETIEEALRDFRPDVVVHFAAETHVTRSERQPDRFNRTNAVGTRVILEASASAGVRRFVHISTDEVYGPVLEGCSAEDDKMVGDGQATSPYAKSKAVADDLARGWQGDLQVVVARATNCFGPWQFPEKAVARWITRGLREQPLFVWGDGGHVRQWLFSDDLTRAVLALSTCESPQTVYNVGPRHDPELTNLDLARWLVEYLQLPDELLVVGSYDRPQHDRRYAVDTTRIEAIGWRPTPIWDRLSETVEWYRSTREWWEPLVPEAESIYQDAR